MKNITLKLSIFSMILLSTILFSCKEEPPMRSDDGIRITNSTTFSNPYDSVGIWHNIILSEFENQLDIRVFNSEYDTTIIYSPQTHDSILLHCFVDAFNETNFTTNLTFSQLKDFDEHTNWRAFLVNDTTFNSLNNIKDSLNVTLTMAGASQRDKNYCLRIIEAAKSCFENTNQVNELYLVWHDSLDVITNDISNVSWHQNEYFALMMLSVITYSTEFWENNPNLLTALTLKSKTQLLASNKDKFNRAVAIGALCADASGAIAGAAYGAGGGTVVMPFLGTLTGAGFGAIAGAAVNSGFIKGIGEAVETIWDAFDLW
jgi:hypothetical protein